MTNRPRLKYRIIREIIGLIGIVELVLGVYCGYQFGEQETLRAWLFVGILAVIGYTSTRLWIWVLEQMR